MGAAVSEGCVWQAVVEAASGQEVLPHALRTKQEAAKAAAAHWAATSAESDVVRQRELYAAAKEAYGSDHVKTLTAGARLAAELQAVGDMKEAEELLRQSAQGLEEQLGVLHPTTATVCHNLAVLLDDEDNLLEAEVFYRKALDASEVRLGESHPETLETASNLAALLCTAGRAREAADCLSRFDGVGYATPRFTLVAARVLQAAGRLSLAEFTLRRARRQTGLSPSHPDSLALAERLGEVLLIQHGQSLSRCPQPRTNAFKGEEVLLQEAELLFREGRTCGLSKSAEGLAQVLLQRAQAGDASSRQLRLHQAEGILRSLLDSQKDGKASTPPPTSSLARQASLAFCLQLQGRTDEAAAAYREVLPEYIQWASEELATAKAGQWQQPMVLGPTPLGAASAAANCAALGVPQAPELLRWALNICRATVGQSHSTTHCVAQHLHRVLLAGGLQEEASGLEEEFNLAADGPPPTPEAKPGDEHDSEALLASWPKRGRQRWRSASCDPRRGKISPGMVTCCQAARRFFLPGPKDSGAHEAAADQACEECKPSSVTRSSSCPARRG